MIKKYHISWVIIISLSLFWNTALGQKAKTNDELILTENFYLENIDIADRFCKKYQFDDAIAYYLKALAYIPNDAYANGKINRIRDIQSSLNTESEEFNQLILNGIKYLNKNHFADAILCFKKARKIFPRNAEVKMLISKTKELETTHFKILEAFNKEIDLAYNYISDSNYAEAIVHLNNAYEIDSDNWAVNNEIAKYNSLSLKQMREQFDDYDPNNLLAYASNISIETEAVSETDSVMQIIHAEKVVANEKLQKDINQKFSKLVAKADSIFSMGMLKPSVVVFKDAYLLKPEDVYVQNRISEINNQLAEIAAVKTRDYNVALVNADRLYKMKSYDKAIGVYRKACNILPKEEYPVNMVNKILKMMEDNIIFDIVNDNIIVKASATEVFMFDPVSVNVRRSNYLFMKAANLSGNAFKIIVNYGSNKGKNGGFVVHVPEGQDFNDYIIRVGNQYKWFSDDNNWVSIYPEKGDVEISLIRISRSD